MRHMDQNGQNGESGRKNEGGKMLLEPRLYRAGHAVAHGTHPRTEIPWASCCSSLTCGEEWRCALKEEASRVELHPGRSFQGALKKGGQ